MRKNIFKGLTKQKAISTLEKLINSKENLNYCYQIVEGLGNGDFDGNADPQIYLYWLTKLAENDSHLAMNKLGQIYSNGQIVPIDIDKAKYWYTKALQSNDYVVKQNFAHMLMTISDDPDDNKQ